VEEATMTKGIKAYKGPLNGPGWFTESDKDLPLTAQEYINKKRKQK
jgi:hypothetical protein